MKYFLPLLLLPFVWSCANDDTLSVDEVQSIRYGTSFGMCADYCLKDMEVSSEWVYFTSYGWNDSVKPKSKTIDFDLATFEELLSVIDKDKFLALDPVIGCPDCADGGAEWIEMQVDDRMKKVTFEYGKDIDGIAEAIAELRELAGQLDY